MKLNISLSSGGWIVPSDEDLILEYKYEYNLPQRNWPMRCKTIDAKYPLFENEQDFITKVRAGRIVDLRKFDPVHNMTNCRSIQEIKDMVSRYAFPRDVDRIVQGYKDGVMMPMPIIIQGAKSSWILSGNTRQNVALVMKIPVKAIIVDAS